MPFATIPTSGAALLAALTALQEPAPPTQEPAAPAPVPAPALLPAPQEYPDPATAPDRLRAIAEGAGATLVELARSVEDRPVLAATFGARQDAGRPEVWIVANLEGDRIAATEVALRLCERLARGDSPLAAAATVHVLPLANPDGAARAFRGEDPWRGSPVDEDRDGLLDEDGPRDLDGDGRALWVRVRESGGDLLPDPADARATRAAKRDEGEAGGWTLLREGADADADRVHAEDGAGGVRLDRNFPQRWREHEPAAGIHALSEPEARGLADFLLAHPHVALVIVLDDEDNLANPPAGKEGMERDAAEILRGDALPLKWWSKRLHGEDGKFFGEAKPRGGADAAGSFADFAYFQVGALVIESALWSMPRETKREGHEDLDKDASDEAKELRWLDARCAGAGFAPWREFQHPRFGAVEIGGWLPLARVNPPHSELDGIAARWSEFCDGLAQDFARLEWQQVELRNLGGGTWEARATLVNVGRLATMSAAGAENRRPRPLRVALEVPGGEILSGRAQQSVERLEGLGGHREFRWIFRVGAHGARLRAGSQTAGEALLELEVQ